MMRAVSVWKVLVLACRVRHLSVVIVPVLIIIIMVATNPVNRVDTSSVLRAAIVLVIIKMAMSSRDSSLVSRAATSSVAVMVSVLSRVVTSSVAVMVSALRVAPVSVQPIMIPMQSIQ
jgi:hypothetical protein